jgi:Holliday junction resolvasome RuvABC ATP-dependent DNA helicase subunit
MTRVPHQLTPEELARRLDDAGRGNDTSWIERAAPDIFGEGGPVGSTTPQIVLKPSTNTSLASRNPLRPQALGEMIGQEKLKPLLRRLIDRAKETRRPLDPILLVGGAGTGKTTTAIAMANEIGTRVFELKAPLTTEILLALRSSAVDGDVVFIDEIHMQVTGDRRGLTQAADPESFYLLLEDHILATPTGPLDFPDVTWIGATTDVGLLPEPLSMRFPLQPRLQPYDLDEMIEIARRNMLALKLNFQGNVAPIFGGAARGTPRVVNSYVRSARMLAEHDLITEPGARQVVEDLCSTTLDGLTESMQIVLRFLYQHCRRETKDGPAYKASVNALATAAGHGRDTKAISLLVEPELIKRGLLSVTPGGRQLTDAGIERAKALVADTS